MREITDLKIAFVGVSHWHVPLYLCAIKPNGLNLVAVSDRDAAVAERVGEQMGCRAYTDADLLLDQEKPDFVFAFDIHSEMPNLAMNLVRRGIPFSIEKPLGVCAQDVQLVKQAAEENGVYCSIPLVWRYSKLVKEYLGQLRPEDISNLSFTFVAGPPDRYIKPSPWMLQKETAGSGCMTNLGVHFIDLALLLTGSDSGTALGSSFHYMNGYTVEDYAASVVKLSSGASLVLQTGYAYPMDEENKRENMWTITTKDGYYVVRDGCLDSRRIGEQAKRERISTDSDDYYAVYTVETLRDYVQGRNPAVGLGELLSSRLVLDDIIAKAGM